MDGRSYSGIFYTATPFSGKKFEIAIRAAKPLVRPHFTIHTFLIVFQDKTGRVMSSGTVEIGSTMVIPYDKIVSLKANKINSFDKRKGTKPNSLYPLMTQVPHMYPTWTSIPP